MAIFKNRLKMPSVERTTRSNKFSIGSVSWLSPSVISTQRIFCTAIWNQKTFCLQKIMRRKSRISVFQKCWIAHLTWLKQRQGRRITCRLRCAWARNTTTSQTCGCSGASSMSSAPSGGLLRATASTRCYTKLPRRAIRNFLTNFRLFTTN